MFVETLQKIVITKSFVSFLLLAVAEFIKEYKDEGYDKVPSDNYPHPFCH